MIVGQLILQCKSYKSTLYRRTEIRAINMNPHLTLEKNQMCASSLFKQARRRMLHLRSGYDYQGRC